MDDRKEEIIEIRKGLVGQFILAAGQFVGEIDRILSRLGFKDENIINLSPMLFAYFSVRMVIIEITNNLHNIEFSYTDEYKKAIAKTWASNPTAAPELEKDLEIATKLFNKAMDNSIITRNFNEQNGVTLSLSKEFVEILFNAPLRDEKLKNDLIREVSNFYAERHMQLKTLFEKVITKIENTIESSS